MNKDFKKLYYKYKIKYLSLKKQIGGQINPRKFKGVEQIQGQQYLVPDDTNRGLLTRFIVFDNSKHHGDDINPYNRRRHGSYEVARNQDTMISGVPGKYTKWDAMSAARSEPNCVGFTYNSNKNEAWFHTRIYRTDIGNGDFIPINNNQSQLLYKKEHKDFADNIRIKRRALILLSLPNNEGLIEQFSVNFIANHEVHFYVLLTYNQILNFLVTEYVNDLNEAKFIFFDNGINLNNIQQAGLKYNPHIRNSARKFLEFIAGNIIQNLQNHLFLCAGYLKNGQFDIEFGLGGGEDQNDNRNLYTTARRELREETGIIANDQLDQQNLRTRIHDLNFRYINSYTYNRDHDELFFLKYTEN